MELEAHTRDIGHDTLQDFVVECVPFGLAAVAFRFTLGRLDVQARLQVQRANERIRIEEELEKWIEQPPDEAQHRARRIVDGCVVEGINRFARRFWCGGGRYGSSAAA